MKRSTRSQQWLTLLEEKIPRSQWILFLSLLLVGATALLGFAGIHTPWEQGKARLQQRFEEEQQKSELLSTIRFQMAQLNKQEEGTLMRGGTPFLTSEVSRIASKSGLQIESVVPQPDYIVGPYTRNQIRVMASATFFDLLNFLRSLEESTPLLKIDQIEVGTPSTFRSGSGYPRNINVRMPEEESLDFLENHQRRMTLVVSGFSKKGAPVP